MTQAQMLTALNAYAYWEANSTEHQKNGRDATWQGAAALQRKAGATDTPRFFTVRILKVTGDISEFHLRSVCEYDNNWTFDSALP